jgi:hypothetical protein
MAYRHQDETTKAMVRKAVLLLAAVSALTMPVSYTGGRSVAHPHAFVQLFFDAASGTTNHHNMSGMSGMPGMAHHHAPPVHREVFLVDVPDDTPIVTMPGGAMEQVALIGSVLAAGYALVLAGLPRIGAAVSRLTGIDVIPDSPPPRAVAIV